MAELAEFAVKFFRLPRVPLRHPFRPGGVSGVNTPVAPSCFQDGRSSMNLITRKICRDSGHSDTWSDKT